MEVRNHPATLYSLPQRHETSLKLCEKLSWKYETYLQLCKAFHKDTKPPCNLTRSFPQSNRTILLIAGHLCSINETILLTAGYFCKKLDNKKFSILANHLGTPTHMYNEEGETTWQRSLDSNGNVKTGNNSSCPFLFQGQYYDEEIELAYNRFRYYDPNDGRYISQDPIGLLSGEFNLYNYVDDTNGWVDILGLTKNSYTVYKKKNEEYVGSAKGGAKKRYGNDKVADDKIAGIPDYDTARGVEQVVMERGGGANSRGNVSDLTNQRNAVDPKNKAVYKDGKTKYDYRTSKAKEFLKKKYGNDWGSQVDTLFGF